MGAAKVRVFFYGSFINKRVLAEVGLVPQQVEVASLRGFDIRIGPLANVVRAEHQTVYGIVCEATHAELERLYAQDWVGTYLPEAVLVETTAGLSVPALCYVAPEAPYAPATADYLDRIIAPARELGFPSWYLDRLESSRSSGEPSE